MALVLSICAPFWAGSGSEQKVPDPSLHLKT